MGKREEQKQKRKREILYAALDLFVNKGYSATKISDIAESVSMSVGLLFHYFESKEQLYQELVELGLQGTKMPIEMKCDSPIAYFETFTAQLFATMKQEPYVAKMFTLMAQTQKNISAPENIREIALQVNTIEAFVPLIEMGQKQGNIRLGNPKAISNAYWCSIQGIAEQFAIHPDMELPEPEWIVDIVRGEKKL